jgi:hypothetical protein
MKCPICASSPLRVIYMGFPMWLCSNEECSCLFGFWSFVADLLPISDGEHFAFLAYDGWYLPALWCWLTGRAL